MKEDLGMRRVMLQAGVELLLRLSNSVFLLEWSDLISSCGMVAVNVEGNTVSVSVVAKIIHIQRSPESSQI